MARFEHLTPAVLLSALLLDVGFGVDWKINGTETKAINSQTIDSVILSKAGNLTVNSTGNSTINKMTMIGFDPNASASFNVNGGNLNLDLSFVNSAKNKNAINFDVKNGSTLTITSGKNGQAHGIFNGSNTDLTAKIAGGGKLDGFLNNDGISKITIAQGGTLSGGITQTGGNLTAEVDGKLEGSIIANQNVGKVSLWANKGQNPTTQSATITGNISIEGGQLEGIMKGLKLEGNYTQTGGTSDIAFHHSSFQSTTTLSNAQSTLHFYATNLKSVVANGGNTTINLKGDINNHTGGSHMENYTGNNGSTTINLIEKSSMQAASQAGGSLNISADDSEIKGSITGSNRANLTVKADNSTIDGNISNIGGTTLINTQGTKIQGNISQTGGKLKVEINNTTVSGSITQTGGEILKLNVFNSEVKQGITLTQVTNRNPRDDVNIRGSTIDNGIRMNDLVQILQINIDRTTVNGGYHQTGGAKVTFNANGVKLNDGIHLNNSATGMNITGSTVKGGIVSINNNTDIQLVRSTSEDRIDVSGGTGRFSGRDGSVFNGNLIANNNANTELTLEGVSKLVGDVKQNNGTQEITLSNRSEITGSIFNNQTTSTVNLNNNSTLRGDLHQESGKLELGIGGGSEILGNVLLNQAETNLTNGRAQILDATIKGNITQTGGKLTGNIGGLKLHGKFTQDGGETGSPQGSLIFRNSTFMQETTIKNAALTKIYFDNDSRLKSTTITNSHNANNTFTLDHRTILEGDFKLEHSKVTLGIKNDSKITGNVSSLDVDNELKFDIQTGGQIGGNVHIENGKTSGTINGGVIGGDLILKDATSSLQFVDSTIKGKVDITRGTNQIDLINTKIGKDFSMQDKGPTQPTLKLKISHSSSIGGDLYFKDTEAFVGGEGVGSVINGNFIMENSTITNGGAQYGGQGAPLPISGLTVNKELKQSGGIMDLTFSNQSNIKGKTTLDKGDFSHLIITGNSQIGEIELNEGKDNLISIENQSKQTGAITLNKTKVKIQALAGSSITGDITATGIATKPSETEIVLDASTLKGNITQNNGKMKFDFKNGSRMDGVATISQLESFIATLNNSVFQGQFIATSNQNIKIDLSNRSTFGGVIQANGNDDFVINADASTIQGELTLRNPANQNQKMQINLKNGATLNNTKMSVSGNLQINATDSVVNSQEIGLTIGKLDLALDHSKGTIAKWVASGATSLSINTSNRSDSEITNLEVTDNASLILKANTSAVLKGHLDLKKTATASITSSGNANLKLDITPEATTKLNINLDGGILEGTITQADPIVGTMNLQSSGGFGGRWIVTGDSAIKDLIINNSTQDIQNDAFLRAPSENTPLSLVDTTRDVGGSRIGLGMIAHGGNPQVGQTVERFVKLGNLSGNNGLFRVYADLGTDTSDKIFANTASGNHIVQVYYNPATFTQDLTGKNIVVVHVDDQQTQVDFKGGTTSIGTQDYTTTLNKVINANGGFDWIIGSTQNDGPNYGTKVIASILQSQYRSFTIQNETLNQRLGELKNIQRIHGVWAKHLLGKNQTRETNSHIAIQDTFYSTWLGYDQNTISLRGQNFIGFALNYTLVKPDSKEYQGQIHNFGFNFYDTFFAKNDFYFDIVAKYVLSYGSYNVDYFSLSKNAPEYFNHKFLISAEIGKKFKLTPDPRNYFYLQPEAQITSGYIHSNSLDFVDFTDTLIHANIAYTFPVIMRAGLFGAYALEYSSMKADFRLGSSFVYELRTGGNVFLEDSHGSTVTYRYPANFQLLFQGGINLSFNDSARIYLEASTGFLGVTHTNYAFNAGVRFVFGPKNTRRLKVPSYAEPKEPPKPPYDPRNIPVITDNTKSDIYRNGIKPPTPPAEDYFINTRTNFRDRTSLK